MGGIESGRPLNLPGAISKDLRRLADLDIVEYVGEGDSDAKRPVLKDEHVVIEPIVYTAWGDPPSL